MINYSLIKNKTLRALVESSASIQGLPEKERAALFAKILALPLNGRKMLIKVLQKEQRKIQEMEAEEQQFLDESLKKIKTIKKGMEKNVRVSHETREKVDSEKMAEDLLKSL